MLKNLTVLFFLIFIGQYALSQNTVDVQILEDDLTTQLPVDGTIYPSNLNIIVVDENTETVIAVGELVNGQISFDLPDGDYSFVVSAFDRNVGDAASLVRNTTPVGTKYTGQGAGQNVTISNRKCPD